MGRGDEKMADQAAVDAMRTTLNSLAIEGTVVIGEAKGDEAPMLYIGEKVGGGGPKIDIALDPLEGTTITAWACPMRWPSWRWPSMAASSMRPTSTWTRSRSAAARLRASSISTRRQAEPYSDLAKAKKIDVVRPVVIPDRPRHSELIAKVREAGARIC
jgi:fructose-1,6-bisphosphatase II / sedoheptulose-1,7-bisphosphatase